MCGAASAKKSILFYSLATVGAKNVVTAAITLSALCCLAVPFFADRYGLTGMWFILALMGAVQGPLFPTSTVFLSRWMPKRSDGPDEKAWVRDVGLQRD